MLNNFNFDSLTVSVDGVLLSIRQVAELPTDTLQYLDHRMMRMRPFHTIPSEIVSVMRYLA